MIRPIERATRPQTDLGVVVEQTIIYAAIHQQDPEAAFNYWHFIRNVHRNDRDVYPQQLDELSWYADDIVERMGVQLERI